MRKLFIFLALFCFFSFMPSSSADTLADIRMEAEYILACQYMIAGNAYGAINNIYGDPTWVVPRENAMAILGLIMASQKLGDTTYLDRAELAADYLVSVQDANDGAWHDQYNFDQVVLASKSPTQTAEVMIAFYKLGYDEARYASMKKGAQFLLECQKVINKTGNDDGLLCGGKDAAGNFYTWRWTHDNSYAYQALKAAQGWARIKGDTFFSSECEQAAARIIEGINNYLYNAPAWHIVIDANGTSLGNPDLSPPNNNLPSWIKYAPQMLDLPAQGVNSLALGEWIHNAFQQADGSCIGYVEETWEPGILKTRKYPGLSFQAALCWLDLGQDTYAQNAWNWAKNSGLWQTTLDGNGIKGGWIDWKEISPNPGAQADWWLRFIDTSFYAIAALSGGYDFNIYVGSELEEQLSSSAVPYIKYFKDRALSDTPSPDGFVFEGLTRSFQLYLDGHGPEELALIENGAAAYDQTILGRISLASGQTTILDTYVDYFHQLQNILNPVINTNGDYKDENEAPLLYGPYRMVRILGRTIPNWWTTWDWIVDTGAAAELILYAGDAYQKTQNLDYKNLAILFAGYILQLQDDDGGIRYGPRRMYHPDDPVNFYWHLKSTEQNERSLCALKALYEITGDTQYSNAAAEIESWLKNMYDSGVHLFHSAAVFDDVNQVWEPTDFGYVATDVMAFAPLELMFSDAYFGATQADRNAEVDAMFAAIEERTQIINGNGTRILFRFSVSQDPQEPDYGTVEMSAQMALAYLRAAQNYYAQSDDAKTQEYLNKYNALVSSLEGFFTIPADDPDAKVAPYASHFADGSVAGGVPTGTGYSTYNCQAALASAYYAFAKAGYDPSKLGGGAGIPQTFYTLNLKNVPWYSNASPYASTGAAVSEMILNYIRNGAGEPLLTQNEIYEYAKFPAAYGPELVPDEADKALGHFDPYDYLVSNSYDSYDSLSGGNPYQGYNFSVDTHNPSVNPNALSEYMRDICHWMAYQVTQEYGVPGGNLTARPNTPAALPLFGTYGHWVVVKGYAASENPTPDPNNPWYTPDFTVYGFWMKDPLVNGIGKDTYKTAAECASTYFQPLATQDAYNGLFLQVAEPPVQASTARVEILAPTADLANFKFIGIEAQVQTTQASLSVASVEALESSSVVQSWRDIVDPYLLSDPEAVAAFEGAQMGQHIPVKRTDKNSPYYLVPFGRQDARVGFLASGVIMLDAIDGYFKEASWTKSPEKFLKVDKKQAIALVDKYVARYQSTLLSYFRKYAAAELVWQPRSYSASPFQPYWKVSAGSYVWYVTQEGKVIAKNIKQPVPVTLSKTMQVAN